MTHWNNWVLDIELQNGNNYFQNGYFTDSRTNYDNRYSRKECVVVTEKPTDTYLDKISKLLINTNINDAKSIYPKIRVLIDNGKNLYGSEDMRRDRINVEIKNNIIIKVLGFY